jgi:ketosteroid isomerase-like protein
MSSAIEAVVVAFIDAINAHDVDRIVALCTSDHQFVDAFGAVMPAEQLRAGWDGYFKFMPRYGIEREDMICHDDLVAVFGYAWGGLDVDPGGSRQWRRPAAWRARVRDGQVALWQVYVDTKIVFDLLASGN